MSHSPSERATNYAGVDLTRHPALNEAYRIACLIEACGASPELTTASCAAFDFIRTLDQALQAAGWRPIETAPKDGTYIIAWCVHLNAKYDKDPIGNGWAVPVIAKWIDFNGGGWTWRGLCGVFTHWMPLPCAQEQQG